MAIRVYPTGFAAEAWRVDRDGEHLADVTLTIHASGRGSYRVTSPRGPLVKEGSFTFDVWDRTALRGVLLAIVRAGAPGAAITVEITRPSR